MLMGLAITALRWRESHQSFCNCSVSHATSTDLYNQPTDLGGWFETSALFFMETLSRLHTGLSMTDEIMRRSRVAYTAIGARAGNSS